MSQTYENILIRQEGQVGIVQINRPKAMNALNSPTMLDITDALQAYDQDKNIGCMVLTGNERAFAAGADIKQMARATVVEQLSTPFLTLWDRLLTINKPIIAAVSGYCLGGGNELAMACDMIVAAESAKFGQPEINIGVIPGLGGTQRLTRVIGKAAALDMRILAYDPFVRAEKAQTLAAELCDERLVLVLEGGYNPQALRDSVEMVIWELLGDSMINTKEMQEVEDAQYEEIGGIIQRVKEVHRRYWHFEG